MNEVIEEKRKSTLKIQGMHCASCAQKISKELNKFEGINNVNVNIATNKAYFTYNPLRVDKKDIVDAIERIGYGATPNTDKIIIKIGGMTCASCAQTVEKALKNSSGIISANVNITTEKATIVYDTEFMNYESIADIINKTGYKALNKVESSSGRVSYDKEIEEEEQIYNLAKKRLKIVWAFNIPIIIWMLFERIGGIIWPNELIYNLGIIVLAIFPLLWAGYETYFTAFKAVRHGSVNMDVLIALGTLSAFITGPLSFIIPVFNYAGVGAMIMAFHLTGRYIETKAKGRASQAIRKLLELGAKTATIIIDGKEKEIPIEDLQINDIMLIRPGAKIPTDGIIIEGKSYIDESMASGESLPVKKNIGDEVIGATINQKGLLKVKATKIGEDTFLAQVIHLVEECQGSKVPIQKFADKITSYFVPTVLVISLIGLILWMFIPQTMIDLISPIAPFIPWVNLNTGLITLAISAFISTLVIACPCALGLATPTALMVGSGLGAENGILIRRGEAIQTLRNIDVIIFDKTGTITKGSPEITNIHAINGFTEEEIVQYAGSVEKGSEHPLADAIVRKSKELNLELYDITNFKTITGKGVKANIVNKYGTILVGSKKLLVSYNY